MIVIRIKERVPCDQAR